METLSHITESSPRIISCDRQGTLGRNEVVWDMYNVLHYSIFVLGGSGVGKTHLVKSFADHSTSNSSDSEHQTYQKQVRLLDKCIDSEELTTVLLQIDEGSSINLAKIENMNSDGIGFICMYSVDSRQSFEELGKHLRSVLMMNPKGEPPPMMILGNKMDLVRQISTEECQSLAQTYACPFLEISAYTSTEEAFSAIIREISFKKGQQNLSQSKSGYLEKRGGDLVKKWKKRWVVLKGPKLYYYHHEKKESTSRKDRENERTKREVDLINCQVEDSPRVATGFLIRSCSRCYEFRAATVDSKVVWTRLIIHARETYNLPPFPLSSRDTSSQNPTGLVRCDSATKSRSPVFKYNSMDSLFSVQSRRKSVCEIEENGDPTKLDSSRTSNSWIGQPNRLSVNSGLQPSRSSRYSFNANGQIKSSNSNSTQSSPVRLRNSIVLSVNCSSLPVTPYTSSPTTPTANPYKQTILPADFDELPPPPSPVLSSPSKSSERKRRLKFFGRMGR